MERDAVTDIFTVGTATVVTLELAEGTVIYGVFPDEATAREAYFRCGASGRGATFHEAVAYAHTAPRVTPPAPAEVTAAPVICGTCDLPIGTCGWCS